MPKRRPPAIEAAAYLKALGFAGLAGGRAGSTEVMLLERIPATRSASFIRPTRFS